MKSKESNSSDYDIEEINKQIASPKISYEPIKAKPKYERGRKSSFGNLNQNQFDD